MALGEAHHDGSALHVPDDAPGLGDTATVFLRTPRGVPRVWVRSTPDAEPAFTEGVVDRETAAETWWRCEVEVRNPLTGYRFLTEGAGGPRWVNGTGTHAHDVTDAADFRLSADPPPPSWSRDAVVYQVFPDRFARSDEAGARPTPPWARAAAWDDPVEFTGPDTPLQLFGGDLDGVTARLDHVTALGADTLYLTPFFPGESNHRYNASSFDRVDELLGGDEALARLTQEAHTRGLRVIGDLTTNHTGDTHEWFRRALAGGPERSYYYFDDDGGYADWLGFATLAKLRFGSAELRHRLVEGPGSVAAKWLSAPFDLDGWRIDVANMTGRHGLDDHNATVARTLRATMAEIGPDRLLLAEHSHDPSGDLGGDGWHGVMNYAGFTRPVWQWVVDAAWAGHADPPPFARAPGGVVRSGAEVMRGGMTEFGAAVPWRQLASSWTLLGSHDTARIATVVGDPGVCAVAEGLLFTLPGAPMLFAGDEIGQQGVLGEDSRRPFPWHDEGRWDRRALASYRSLIALRRGHDALRRGGLRWVHADGDVAVYLRESPAERLLVLAARAPHPPVRLDASALGLDGEAPTLYGGAARLLRSSDGSVSLPGDGPTFQVWQLA